jgi:hypothetical protein
MFDSEVVVIPAFSISRCASPTDQQHTGQAGTNTTMSTRPARKCPMIATPVNQRAATPLPTANCRNFGLEYAQQVTDYE